jgi:hypothetical protein
MRTPSTPAPLASSHIALAALAAFEAYDLRLLLSWTRMANDADYFAMVFAAEAAFGGFEAVRRSL